MTSHGGGLLRAASCLAAVACLFFVPAHTAKSFPWNCQSLTQDAGVGSDGPVAFTFGQSGASTSISAFTCDDIDHSVVSIPGGVPRQLPFVPGPQGIDPQELLKLAGITSSEQTGVSGMEIGCLDNAYSYAAGKQRPGQPVPLSPAEIADTSKSAVFIVPNAVPGASFFVDPTRPYDSGQNWFSCPGGWAITIDTTKAPTLVVPTPLASAATAAAGTTQVSFSLPSAVSTRTGAPASSFEYAWNFGDGTPSSAYSTNPAATHIFGQAGRFPVSVSVIDRQGDYGLSAPVTVTVTPPTLTVATPAVTPASATTTGVVAGTPLTFTTSVNLNGLPDRNSLAYHWSFGNGGSSMEASPTYAYPAPGTYAVTVSVADKSVGGPHGSTVFSQARFVQVNAASGMTVALPMFSPGIPISAQPVQFSVPSVSLNGQPDTQPLNFQWSFGDGSPPQSSTSPSISYTYACHPSGGCLGSFSSAMFKVTVTVTDASAGVSATSPPLALTVSDSGPLTVAAPTVNPSRATFGAPVQFSPPTVTLKGVPDTNFLTYQWIFSDGGSSTALAPDYTFKQTGQVTATVTVTDAAGNRGTSPPTTVQVAGATSLGTKGSAAEQTIAFTSTPPPEATIGGPIYSVAASASSRLPVTLSIDASASSVCSLAGSTVTFLEIGTCVIDANQPGNVDYLPAQQAQQSFPVVAKTGLVVSTPTATPTGKDTFRFDPPSSVTLNGSPDTNGLLYVWTLGDGTTATGPTPAHRYTGTGVMQVSVTVTDAAGNSGTSPAIAVQIGTVVPKGNGSGGGNGNGTGSGNGNGVGNGSGSGSGGSSTSSSTSGASGGAAAKPSTTPAITHPATTTPAKPKPVKHPPASPTKIPASPARSVPTPPLVGYLIESPGKKSSPVTTPTRPAVSVQANPAASAAAGGGGSTLEHHSFEWLWLLGILLAFLVLLAGAGLELKPLVTAGPGSGYAATRRRRPWGSSRAPSD